MDYCAPKGIPLEEFLRWGTYSQWAALEWQAYESRRCSGCGTHPDDDGPRWTASLVWCPGCADVEKVGASPEAKHPGMRVHMSR